MFSTKESDFLQPEQGGMDRVPENQSVFKKAILISLLFLTGCANTNHHDNSTVQLPARAPTAQPGVQYIPVCDPEQSQIILGTQQVITPTGKITIYCGEGKLTTKSEQTNMNQPWNTSSQTGAYRQIRQTDYRAKITGKVTIRQVTERSGQSITESDKQDSVLTSGQNNLVETEKTYTGIVPGTENDQRLEYPKTDTIKLYIVKGF